MRALIQCGYGSPGQVALQEVPSPAPGTDDLLVRVQAAGLNAADRFLLRGEPFAIRALAGGLRRPRAGFVVGRALAGRVEAVGEAVRDFVAGDEVMAECTGAIGELAVVPVGMAARKPVGVTFAEAAALPIAGTTALAGVRRISSGQRFLVTGASGGIGTFAVQLAVAKGATVAGVCSERNAALVRKLGAQQVIDYEKTGADDLRAAGERFDVILDLAGNYPVAALRRILAPGGTLLLSVGTGGRWLGPARRLLKAMITGHRQVRALTVRPDPADLSELATMVATGQIRPVIDDIYRLDEAPAALDRLDRGWVAGKIIVAVAE
ncbi:NAD(P)-dependent alcohol dehydrogenase [Actinoplanes xinjiangensis]|uniref:NADPH:quinone reductase-like Zn-dependent oxidoreductase n=1 Tax=Actinoplanes xinjiangensis TaxID=512350 RepID=A0A316EV77_9ACTN|nr:NAD(P)-dependent alcohol dehydrogenase [Actinoplanes xinjiangensis]PWK36146.1 NADPH:quinone reductase-like Zn-dependent oxidoreductase [Actinoplanes xinjiangensis]